MKKIYQFRLNDSFSGNVVKTATWLNQEFIRQLSYRSNVHESIHNARLCIKRQRALLRLIRPAIGEQAYREENDFHREISQKLAFLRDYSNSLDAVKELRKNRRSTYLDKKLATLYNRMFHQRATLLSHTDTNTLFAGLSAEMREARKRIREWELSMPAEKILHQGFFRMYRQGQRRYRVASSNPNPLTFHQLRKSVKYLMYLNQLVADLWPAMIRTQESELKSLSNALGQHHDLFVFETLFDRLIPMRSDQTYRSRMRQAIWKKKKKLEPVILEQAARIYAETPSGYAAKFKRWYAIYYFPRISL